MTSVVLFFFKSAPCHDIPVVISPRKGLQSCLGWKLNHLPAAGKDWFVLSEHPPVYFKRGSLKEEHRGINAWSCSKFICVNAPPRHIQWQTSTTGFCSKAEVDELRKRKEKIQKLVVNYVKDWCLRFEEKGSDVFLSVYFSPGVRLGDGVETGDESWVTCRNVHEAFLHSSQLSVSDVQKKPKQTQEPWRDDVGNPYIPVQ